VLYVKKRRKSQKTNTLREAKLEDSKASVEVCI